MFYEDLELCRYHNGPFNSDNWHVPLRAIGWLERGHPYSRGSSPGHVIEQLKKLIESSVQSFQQYHFRGLHDCTLCEKGSAEARLTGSHLNLFIPWRRAVLVCPAGIVHYLMVHSYAPPAEFVQAVQECPPYGSPQYLEALREANDRHSVPLVTWEEALREQRKEMENIAQRRQSRLDSK